MAKNQLPDPINKDVIILAGEFTGQEGYCLGLSDQAGIFAVTPFASNRILNLRFDEEFGILTNRN
jgi:hypothetical protein